MGLTEWAATLRDAGSKDAHENLLRMSRHMQEREHDDEPTTDEEYAALRSHSHMLAALRPILREVWDQAFDDFTEQAANGYNPANNNPYED